MTQQLPESPIDGLEVRSVDREGRIYYQPTFQQVHAPSAYRDNEYSIGGLGWWELDAKSIASLPGGILERNVWYKFALATKLKTGDNAKPGSMYMDIKQVRLATDDEIPAQQPTQAANTPQTGSQGRPVASGGDFNTGMAFNQAATLVAALITSHPQARDWLDYDYVIEEVLIMRARLYHEVLMQPIGTPDEEPGAEYEEPAVNEEPEMPEPTVAEEPEPDEPF